MRSATQAVRRSANGTWRNSLGPCAFEPGPPVPVMKNCARREALAQHGHERDRAAQAIEHGGSAEVPPRGVVHGLEQPRLRWRARPSRATARELSKRTRAPYGGSASRISRHALRRRAAASRVGGMRSESLSEVLGRSTLPPSAGAGSPAAPMMDSAGFHVPARSSVDGIVLRVAHALDQREATRRCRRRARRTPRAPPPPARAGSRRGSPAPIAPGLLVLDAREELARDAEARRHDAARRAGVHALGQHLDGEQRR